MVRKLFTQFLIFLSVFLALTQTSFAQETPISFEADSVIVNQSDNSLVATGNVILRQGFETISADQITYYQNENRALARKNVKHTAADGTVTHARSMELDSEFSHIVAETLVTRSANGEWMGASRGERFSGEQSIFEKSRFTPCKCEFLNGESPLWEIQAGRSVRNERTKTITHYNMSMRVMNVPIGYLPILSHTDWTVRRRSGFLTPRFIISSDLGFTPSIPYYHVIDDTSDFEFTPYKYQYRGLAARSRYRKLWNSAELHGTLYTGNVETYKNSRELVSAIDATFSSRIGTGWNVTTRLNRASQDTFLRRYDFNDDTSLKSHIRAEKIDESRYYLIEASDRQSLVTSNKKVNEPTVLPLVFYEKIQKGWRPNQQYKTELSALQLDNDQQHDLARWTGLFQISEDFQSSFGINGYEANVTGNYYTMHSKPSSATTNLGGISFLTPSVSVNWRLPIAVTGNKRSAIIEPQAKLAYVGGKDQTDKIPNRDASDYRIDEANLFLLNRYQGKDYVLPGSRLDLGVSATAKDPLFGEVTGFAGISRRISGKPSAGLTASENDKYSDFVGSFLLNPANSLYLQWSGRMSSNDLTLNESTTTIQSNFGEGSVSITHNQLARAYFINSDDDREELYTTYSQSLPLGWNFTASQLWDLSNGQTDRKKSFAALTWNGGKQDCLKVKINYEREPIGDRDIDTIEQLNVVLTFASLGSFVK